MPALLDRNQSKLFAVVIAGVTINAAMAMPSPSSAVAEVMTPFERQDIVRTSNFASATDASLMDTYSDDWSRAQPRRAIVDSVVKSSTVTLVSINGVVSVPALESDSLVHRNSVAASEAKEPDVALYADASNFNYALKEVVWKPAVYVEDGEIVFEWIRDGKHAVVSVEGDGVLGYTMLVEGKFISGSTEMASTGAVPADLKAYLA